MEDLKSRQLGMIFTGSFLGAGFVSGQEITQFFAVFGKKGLLGMILAVFLFSMFGYIFVYIAKKEKVTAIDVIVLGEGKSALHLFFNGVSLVFLFGVAVIMLAGAGNLMKELLGVPSLVGSACLAVLLAGLSMKGMKGIVAISQIVVPLLLVLVVVIGLWSICVLPPSAGESVSQSGNPLLGNWFLSMLSFFSYNMLAALAVLTPAAQRTGSWKNIRRGICQGSVQLLLIFSCILIPLLRFQGLVGLEDFPMQALAAQVNPVLGYAYALLLLTAMFSGALSCMFGVTVQIFGEKERKRSVVLLLWAVAFACSMAGFKELIAVVFPLCGYANLLAMPLTLRRYMKIRHKETLVMNVSHNEYGQLLSTHKQKRRI